MRDLLLTGILMLFAAFSGLSQTITVVDHEDLKPIPDVAVLNESNTRFIYTNRSGKVDISLFGEKETICFHHFTYDRICLTYDEIRKMGFEIRLTRKIFAIEEFVISANKWEQNRNEVPNKITTVLKPSVELQNPQTAADLLGISDEVYIQKSQLGGGSPMIRGFATNRILIVVDGVRMNNAIYREGNIQNVISLDPSSLESTEIIFGPGATVYGSDAIGGVMDFHTKKALLSTGEKLYFKADAFSRFSSAAREKTVHLDFNIGSKRMAFMSGLTLSDYDDLKMGARRNDSYLRPEYVERFGDRDSIIQNPDPRIQISSGYSQINIINKLRLKISDNIDIVYANHYSRLSDVPRYDRLIQYRAGMLRYAEWYYGPQIWMMNNLQMTLSKKTRVFDEARFIAAHQLYEESRHERGFGKTTGNEQFEKLSILSFNLDFDKKFGKEKALVYYGSEVVVNNINSDGQIRDIMTLAAIPTGSRYPNGINNYLSYAFYAGYKNNLTEKISLNTGLRYNHVSLNSTIRDNSFFNFPFTAISISNGALTGSAGAVFRPGENLQFNLNLSTGFRAPNLDDAGKIFDSAPGIVVVPNPDLKPEYAYNADLGISKDLGKIFHLDVTGYYTWLHNAMIRHNFLFDGMDSIAYSGELSKVEAITNAGSAHVYGFHINLQAKVGEYYLIKTTLNITEGKENNGVPLRHAAPLFGSTHFILEYSKLKTDFYSNYNGAKKYSKMPPSEIEKSYLYAADKNGKPWSPGWFTLNVKLSYNLLSRLVVNAGVENILNHRYRPYSSGIAAPGRNFIFSLRVVI